MKAIILSLFLSISFSLHAQTFGAELSAGLNGLSDNNGGYVFAGTLEFTPNFVGNTYLIGGVGLRYGITDIRTKDRLRPDCLGNCLFDYTETESFTARRYEVTGRVGLEHRIGKLAVRMQAEVGQRVAGNFSYQQTTHPDNETRPETTDVFTVKPGDYDFESIFSGFGSSRTITGDKLRVQLGLGLAYEIIPNLRAGIHYQLPLRNLDSQYLINACGFAGCFDYEAATFDAATASLTATVRYGF